MSEVITQRYFEIEEDQFVDKGRSVTLNEDDPIRYDYAGLLKRFSVDAAIITLGVGVASLAVSKVASLVLGFPSLEEFMNTPLSGLNEYVTELTLAMTGGIAGGTAASLPLANKVEDILGLTGPMLPSRVNLSVP